MNSYEARQAARKARLESRAERLRAEAQAKLDAGKQMFSVIPFGQPILVGHHSERADRNYRNRAHNKLGAGYAALKAAEAVERQADAVGSGGISSDDPDATAKLRQQLAKAEAFQARMVAGNAVVRRHKADHAAGIVALTKIGFSADQAAKLFTPDFAGRLGFPSYATTNNAANIRRLKTRIAALETAAQRTTQERTHLGVRIVENAEENRLQLFFPGKPSEPVRRELKSFGFRWSPLAGAWQRQLSNGAAWAAECVLKKLEAA